MENNSRAFAEANTALRSARRELSDASNAWDKLPDDASDERVDEARQRVNAAVEKTEAAEQRVKQLLDADVHVRINEPDLYTERSEHRFIDDLFRSKILDDPISSERIARHQAFEVDKRAISTGGLGGIIPPDFLVAMTAKAPRGGRVFADQCNRQPLPDIGMSLVIPRLTQGTAAGVQASESETVATQDAEETDLTIPVRTIAGYVPVSRQVLERGTAYSEPLLFEDLIARVWSALDVQCLNGSGSSGQILGLMQTEGLTTLSAGSSGTVQTLWNTVADAIQQILTKWGGLGIQPAKIVMHPRRWGAISAYLDDENRPLFGYNNVPVYAAMMAAGDTNTYGFVGYLQGLPVFTDANLPLEGTNNDEDFIVVLSDAPGAPLLWEPPDGLTTLTFEEQAGTSLQVQLVAYEYVAFTAGRYPDASAVILDFPPPDFS